ncbi:Gfo/Idh/MocA family oxidoreductase [Streptomyces sp. V4I8]|uniref:Gfo/Idh/MocA family oxidoreductase n=1 Tax=Streptomyces sp. V4I8 TaxID=3156469 RepID=UPI0035162DCE
MGDPLTERPIALRIGLVGAGQISGAYLRTLPALTHLSVTAVADLDAARARAVAATVPGARATTAKAVRGRRRRPRPQPDRPRRPRRGRPCRDRRGQARAEVAHAAIAAGKHVYGEKPLAATTTEARSVLDAAEAAGGTGGLRAGHCPGHGRADRPRGAGRRGTRHTRRRDRLHGGSGP